MEGIRRYWLQNIPLVLRLDHPDIVLLDIKMGVNSGREVLKEIKARWPKQCVIVVTGYPSLDTMRETFKQDVFDYITKPFALDDLRRVLSQATTAFGNATHSDNNATELWRDDIQWDKANKNEPEAAPSEGIAVLKRMNRGSLSNRLMDELQKSTDF